MRKQTLFHSPPKGRVWPVIRADPPEKKRGRDRDSFKGSVHKITGRSWAGPIYLVDHASGQMLEVKSKEDRSETILKQSNHASDRQKGDGL
jgi:hypothetical protein